MQKLQRSTIIAFAVMLPLVSLLTPWINGMMCGIRTAEVTVSLQFLLIAVLFISANAFRVQYLLVCGRSDLYSRIHLIAALIGMPLIFLSIYLFSYLGAVFSTIFTEALVFILTSIVTVKTMRK